MAVHVVITTLRRFFNRPHRPAPFSVEWKDEEWGTVTQDFEDLLDAIRFSIGLEDFGIKTDLIERCSYDR